MEKSITEPPAALIEPSPRRPWAMLVPLIALVLVAVFITRAWSSRGISVWVHFEAGHGLKSGDGLRYRGITVGRVDQITLAPDLSGIDVRLSLDKSATGLAIAGSQFWIVRPRIEAGRFDGLDTIVGARYIDAAPGSPKAAPTFRFVGLDSPPVIVPKGALELVLEAPERGSVGRGAPVTWRRLEVGQVVSVGLSSDARRVLVRIAIEPQFAPLVLTTTRFFETSGFNLGFGFAGLSLEMESLKTLFIGGIAFATPEAPAPPARTGQRFELASAAKDEWLEWQPALAAGDLSSTFKRPQPERAQLDFESGIFGRDQTRRAWVLWTASGLVGPSDVVHAPEGAEDAASLEVSGASFAAITTTAKSVTSLLAGLTPPPGAPRPWPINAIRQADQPENCLATGDRALAPLALDTASLGQGPLPWQLAPSLPIDETWHGAPVTSRTDGKLIGILIVNDEGAYIAAIPTALIR